MNEKSISIHFGLKLEISMIRYSERVNLPRIDKNLKCLETSEFSRPWKEAGKCCDSVSFRLTSYNILSQYYAHRTPHLYRHLEGPNQKYLEWETRWPKICAEIEKLDSGILCLQEVEIDVYDSIIYSFLRSRNYKCKFFKKFNLNDGKGITISSVRFLNFLKFFNPHVVGI